MSPDPQPPLHPPAEQLRAFNLGRLGDEEALLLGAHLDNCPVCCDLMRELPTQDGFVGQVRAAGGDPGASPERVGDYALLREIGRGGMGVVYEAEQLSLGRRVALKVLAPGFAAGQPALDRFRREARLAARLHHTHIVPVYEVGQEGATCFYAMQYIPGQSLDRLIARQRGAAHRGAPTVDRPHPGRPRGEEPAPAPAGGGAWRGGPDEVARVGLQAAGALAYAHARGVLHRDIKPSNLLLDGAGCVWVTDFGLAKAEDDGLTQTGDFLGTLRYMAPERFEGRCDARADVYGLGLTLYELLTLRPAFDSPDRARLMDQIRRDPPPPRSLCRAVPRDLETIVLKAMDRDPARRYAGAAELADDLQRFLDRRPTRARRLSASGRLVRWARRSPAVAGLLACVAVTLLTATGVSTYFAAQARLDARAARAAEAAARKAQDRAVSSEDGARRQSALLLLDRGVALAAQGQVAEGLHWMLAALEATDDPGLQRLARTHLAGWSGRAATLRCWIDTPHQAVALSPDGRRLVTAGAPRPGDRVALQFWDPQEGSPVGGPLPTKDFGVESLSFSPDGRTVLAASGAGQINQYKPGWASRWDAQGRRFLGRSPGVLDLLLGRTHRSTVEGAAWSPDGRRFVTCAWDHTLRVWDAAGGRAVGRPIALGGYGYVAPPAFSPDGETVVLVKDKGVRLVEIAAGRSRDLPVTTPTPYCKSAAFSPDGTTLLLGDGRAGFPTSATALPWDPARRAPAGPPRHTASPSAHLSFLRDGRVVSVAGRQVSADGALFVRGRDGFQVWQSPRARSRPAGDLTSLVGSSPSPAAPLTVLWSADARRCWTAGAGQAAQAWETATGLPVGIPLPDAPLRGYSRLALTPDARLAATEPHGGGRPHPPTVVWDVASGLPACRPLPQKNMLAAMDFSPDGRTLATGGHYHTVDLWDVAAGVPLPHSPLRAGDMIMHLAFSPGGTTVAAATWGREVRLWDARSGKLLATLPHRDVPQRVVFNAAGTRLLTLCPSDAHLWDLASGARVGSPMAFPTVPEGRGLDLRGLFSPDGRVILLAGGFGSFRLHDAATTRPLTRPTPAGKPQRSCFAFSPDGRLVVAGHEDGSAQVWEAASGLPLGAPWVGASPVWGVAFAADGRSVVTVAGPGSFRSWRVPGPLGGGAGRLARALRLATGLRRDAAGAVVPLTRAEWEQERRRWRQTEGDRPWALAAPVSDADWHEARACDAEESGAGFAARWRLDRLIAARPGDWRLYARRARTYTDEGRPELAAADYRRAEARGAGAALTGWYRWRARACASQRRWESVLWYLDRLLARHPDEPGLRQQRADAVARLRLPRKP